MNTFRKVAFLFFAFFVITSSSNSLMAQKYGHLNYGNLLEQLPEMKAANTELETYRDQLIKKGEARAQAWQKAVQEYQKQAPEMTGVQIQQKEQELGKEQQAIGAYEQEVIQLISKKRDEILKPIVDKVNVAVDAIGKENGYSMIFDTSIFNAVLYAQDSDDVEALVKKKLGI